MTLKSAAEFVHLRRSDDPADYRRAAHEDAPLDVWHELVENYADMRVWVARNKAVPVEILQILAADADPDVRSAVADKRKATTDILMKLANDSDESVRLRVATNKKVPSDVLEGLLEDDWGPVREKANQVLRDRG